MAFWNDSLLLTFVKGTLSNMHIGVVSCNEEVSATLGIGVARTTQSIWALELYGSSLRKSFLGRFGAIRVQVGFKVSDTSYMVCTIYISRHCVTFTGILASGALSHSISF